MNYEAFLATKAVVAPPDGIDAPDDINPQLFDFQRDIVRWALRRGRAALFADCGMGKTPMQLEWARHIPGRVLILAPLAVTQQTRAEGEKFGIPVTVARDQSEAGQGITVTNYEMLGHFDADQFTGVVLDESSILKAYDGKTRTQIIETFSSTPYRLACTATPAPNDFMELGNHAEFLGVMSRVEMLSMFFVHDGGETQKWRIKGHAEADFWRWLCSWAVMITKPSDLGYEDGGFKLPPLSYQQHTVESSASDTGTLFNLPAQTLPERIRARKTTVADRVARAAEIVNASTEPWVIWCNLNDEGDRLEAAIHDAVQVTGSMAPDAKEDRLLSFSRGEFRVMVTKPKIAGFGMNWQHCPNVMFVGLSDSWEQYYQAVRRCWRFGQENDVHVHIVTADIEGEVVANIKRKERDAAKMAASMLEHMHDLNEAALKGAVVTKDEYDARIESGDGWDLYLGDCVEWVETMPDDSIDFTIFSPPFASLYTYSASPRDMGNSRDDDEFSQHFRYLIDQLYRVTAPGRLLSFHCMNLPTSKSHHGYIGIRDFRGELIRQFEDAGFIFHSEVTIWKDPVTAMQRTKALGLLHKQLKKDSAMSRQGIPDYLVTMRKPGENAKPVSHTNESFPVQRWQRYASPVWMDINPSDTLQYRSAREHNDERHICPLQLGVIRRALELWTRPDDLVLSPFAGIGSEGYVALQMGRRFVGVELKKSYFEQAVRNLESVRIVNGDLFDRAAS